MASLRRNLSRSRLAPLALFPRRAARVMRHDARVVAATARWLVTSREHHNYTYDLTALNVDHLGSPRSAAAIPSRCTTAATSCRRRWRRSFPPC
jgi:hypothetical protein